MTNEMNGWQPNQTKLEEVMRTIAIFIAPAQVTEVRAIGVEGQHSGYTRVYSGYFDSADAVVSAVAKLPEARGVYFLPNPVKPELIARANNRMVIAQNGLATQDEHILHRRYLIIDLDPVRPSGISSTWQELKAAYACAAEVHDHLLGRGWPEMVIACSGNGLHLVPKIDLATVDSRLVSQCLQALSERFTNSEVSVDTAVGNPARGLRLYGTRARKGDETRDRQHRHSALIFVPDDYRAVPNALLTALAAEAKDRQSKFSNFLSPQQFDVDGWIKKHSLDVRMPKPWQGGKLWVFRVCPWQSDHADGAAFIAQLPNGRIVARCHHASCQGKSWEHLRDAIEPGWRCADETPGILDGTPHAIANAYRRVANK